MYPKLIEDLLMHLIKLPGVGRRSAERMIFWLLSQTNGDVDAFAKSLIALKENLRFCQRCNNFSESEECLICRNPSRDHRTMCIVEDPKDVLAIERTGAFKGVYHVLLGTISPLDGRGPETLKVDKLLERITKENIEEVVIATDPDSDGEMTAHYLTKQFKGMSVKVSRIGLGIPVGSSVEYADLSTLSMSLNSRREIRD